MSAATATTPTADTPPAAKGGKKKLLIIVLVAVLLLALAGGGAAVFMMKQKAAALAEADGGEVDAQEAPAAHVDAKAPPVFMPLDPFTVNLADRDNERYAQIGVTLQIDNSKTSDKLTLYMPAIRNNILMVLSHKTSAELLSREGKDKLALAILHAAVRPLGYEVPEDIDEAADTDTAPAKSKKKKRAPALPIKAVHFSNFIVQ